MSMSESLTPSESMVQRKKQQLYRLAALMKGVDFDEDSQEPNITTSAQTIGISSDHDEVAEDDIVLTSTPIPPSSPPTSFQTSFQASPSLVEASENFSARPHLQRRLLNASYSRRERAKQSPRTPTRSMSYGSTQEFSQKFRDEHVSPSKSREVKFREAQIRLDEVNSEETQRTTSGERIYTTNGTGHIDLRTTSGQDAMTLEEEEDMNELDEEDMEAETQTYAVASQFPEDRRFKTPKTPASRGKKRARNGDVLSELGSTPRSTPRLPVNPFSGGQAVNPGLMSLSQVFGATQAHSSPLLNIPPSEDSERPSPSNGNFGRPASAPVSSPTMFLKTPQAPSEGPYENYESIHDSQKRRRKTTALELASDALLQEDEDGNDLIDQISSEERADILASRRRERDKMGDATRRTFQSITARRPSPAEKNRGKGRLKRPHRRQEDDTMPRTSPAAGRNTLKSTPPVSKLNLCKGKSESPKASQDNEDSQSNGGGEDEKSDSDELGQGGPRRVQVPRTISKRRQIMVLEAEATDPPPQSPLEEPEVAHEIVDVANSQTTGKAPRPLPQESSNDLIVPQSQVPDSTAAIQQPDTQSALAQVKALAALPQSQQTATPPSSTHSPKRPSSSARRKLAMDTSRTARTKASERSITASKHLSGDELTSPDLPATIPETYSADENAEESASSSPKPQTVSPMAKKTHLRRPKKLSAILSQESPPDLSLGDDIFEAFNEITEDHSRFQAALGTSAPQSPPHPGRKRTRRPLAPSTEVPTSNTASNLSPVARSSQAETGNTAFHSAREAREETPVVRPREPPVTTPGQSSSEKENEPTPRRKRPAVDLLPAVESSFKRTQQQPPPSSTLSEPVKAPGRKRTRTGSSLHRRQEVDEVSIHSGVDAQRPSTPSESAAFPNMVWALFSGTPQGYFPARCLGPAENNKLRVRFEDGNESSIPSNSVRRLEIRVGDTVKLGTPETKMNTYVVQELADKQICGPPPTQIQTFSDIHGWTKVRLGLKTKNGPIEPQEELVSYTLLYLTQTLFNGLKDRVYQHPLPEGSVRSQSSSISQSAPGTPSSKQLRASTTMKKQSGLRQSLNVSMTQYGLFSGMAFAFTALEQKKRADLQKVIEKNSGGLIHSGFEDLFDGPHRTYDKSKDSESVPLELDSSSKTIGFTALLTDKHCRTTTYLHALALNIPCMSVRWVWDCVAKGQLLDWSPYLLASGESAVLDGAIRSRTMAIPTAYSSPTSATHWPLASMFSSRRKFMDGANVLITCLQEKQMHGHAFIAYALGASRVALASSHEESQKLIKEGKWDWICSAGELEAQKGRKRKSGVGESTGDLDIQWKNGMRVVKPEFVVQSLVLGRLVSE